VPFSGHGFVGIMNSELEFHRELASSDLNQFGVIGEHGGAIKAQTWSLDSLLHFTLTPPAVHTLITTTCNITYLLKKLPKTRHNLAVINLYNHTMIASK